MAERLTLRGAASRAHRVFYDSDREPTRRDRRLADAFEHTRPGEQDDEDAPTLVRWALPAVLGLVAAFLVGRWWAQRDTSETVIAGFDLLGVD